MSDNMAEMYRYYGYSVTNPSQFVEELGNEDEPVEVVINSRGGSVLDASEIYTAVKEYKGEVTAKIVGFAGSCASWIAMAADKIKISTMGFMMIHNSSTWAEGDKRFMGSTADMLASIDKSINYAYKNKTGLDEKEIADLMDKETWFNAEDAKKYNLVDEIMFTDDALVTNKVLDEMSLPSVDILKVINKSDKKSEGERIEEMNLEELKNKYSDLYDEVLNIGREEERERIKNIEELKIKGFDEEIKKAKFEDITTAEKLAVNILKSEQFKQENFVKDMLEDKGFSVPNDPINQNENKKETEEKNTANSIAEIVNRSRGEK